jgi:hypothetical protein
MREARHAGMAPAVNAVLARMAPTIKNVAGSNGETSKSKLRTDPAIASAPAIPSAIPPIAYRALSGPEAFRRGLGDDNNPGCADSVETGEISAFDNRNAHRVEITGRYGRRYRENAQP